MKWPCINCTESGFGDQSLNEYDLLDTTQDPCTNDWCNLFAQYAGLGGNLYLQTTIPNNFATVQITSIVPNTQQTQTVTCATPCTSAASFPGAQYGGLYQQEGFALPNSSGGKHEYKIAATNTSNGTGILDATHFTCDPSTICPTNLNFPVTLYVGDYLPDTIPFAASHYASTVEVYFCDWEFAYNNSNSQSLGCQVEDTLNGGAYSNILNNP
jgi:hypothetical protein